MSTTVEFFAPPGQSLTLLLCAHGTYTPANGPGDAATETARAGVYLATVDESPALSGWHTAHIVSDAGWELPVGDVYLIDGQVCRVRDHDARLSAEIAALAVVPVVSAGTPPTPGAITILRGDVVSVSLTGLGSLVGRTKLWITGKADRTHPDSAALFAIEETAGLEVINGLPATTAANGTLTVTDESAGDVTITLAGVETAKFAGVTDGAYDVQILDATGPRTLADGALHVTLDVTRATS